MLAASKKTTRDDVPVTQGLLSIVSMLRKSRDFFRAESEIALFSGVDEIEDAFDRVEILFMKYRCFARRVGLEVNLVTLQAILDYPIPLEMMSLPSDEREEKWLFSPWSGWRKA